MRQGELAGPHLGSVRLTSEYPHVDLPKTKERSTAPGAALGTRRLSAFKLLKPKGRSCNHRFTSRCFPWRRAEGSYTRFRDTVSDKGVFQVCAGHDPPARRHLALYLSSPTWRESEIMAISGHLNAGDARTIHATCGPID